MFSLSDIVSQCYDDISQLSKVFQSQKPFAKIIVTAVLFIQETCRSRNKQCTWQFKVEIHSTVFNNRQIVCFE